MQSLQNQDSALCQDTKNHIFFHFFIFDSKGNIHTRIENFVGYRIHYILLAFLVIATPSAFAQESLISVQTDDNNYDEGDTIVISGTVNTRIDDTPVILRILFNEDSLIDIAQVEVAQDGSFSDTVLAEGEVWKRSGEYTIIASYQKHEIETKFTYTPKSEAIETTTIFEVYAGNHGTFDVEYTIKGGTIKDMVVDSESFALIVKIDSTDEGTISLDLPREFIGAEKQDGKDDTFIILIDGIEVAYQESVVHSDSRVITINFEQGDSGIEIIGTYVVPEFGTIVMIILVAGIMISILATRNQLQIRI